MEDFLTACIEVVRAAVFQPGGSGSIPRVSHYGPAITSGNLLPAANVGQLFSSKRGNMSSKEVI